MPEETASGNIAQRIIADADGELVGRIRLQKVAYLLSEAGFAEGLSFIYHHYGPYSEGLEKAVKQACSNELIAEEEKATERGTPYYIYRAKAAAGGEAGEDSEKERNFVRCAKKIPSVVLELAATALYLYQREGFNKEGLRRGAAWLETERRKKFKAQNGRLRAAHEAYQALRAMPARTALPEIPFPY